MDAAGIVVGSVLLLLTAYAVVDVRRYLKRLGGRSFVKEIVAICLLVAFVPGLFILGTTLMMSGLQGLVHW